MKKISKILFIFFISIILGIIMTKTKVSAGRSWTLAKEITYLDGLIARGVHFNADYNFVLLLKHIAAQKRSQLLVMSDDFVLVVQASPDNGIYRAVLASKCGSDTYCPIMISYDFDSIEYHPIKSEAFRFVCPESNLYPLVHIGKTELWGLDFSSNYFVCQTNGDIHRFAKEGGMFLPTKDLSRIDKYFSATYPGLF